MYNVYITYNKKYNPTKWTINSYKEVLQQILNLNRYPVKSIKIVKK